MPLPCSDGLPPERLLDNSPGGLRLLYKRGPQSKSPGAVQRSTLPQRFLVTVRPDRGFKISGITSLMAQTGNLILVNYGI
jgi:hypothetical protein